MLNDKDDKMGELRKAIEEARKAFSDLRPDNGEWVEGLTISDEKFHEDELFDLGMDDPERMESYGRFVRTFGEIE